MGGSSSRHQRKSTKRHTKDSVQSPERAQSGGASAGSGAAAADILEVKINVSDLKDGDMCEVEFEGVEERALLIRQEGRLHAVSNKCTHYGAPLVKGCLGNGRIRCPWHGACFNINTGDIEDFPGLDSLQKFEVDEVENGNFGIVRANKKALANPRRVKEMCPLVLSEDNRTFFIIGGGPASVVCAETLRQEGFKGRVVIATKESVLPYDRPKLSKGLHLKAEEIQLRPSSFYHDNNIEVLLEKEATSVDVDAHTITFADGSSLHYSTLVLATGGKPRSLPIPGFDLKNIFLLREPHQANNIASSAAGKRVVIIGTSFIGMEVAAYLADKAKHVTCVDVCDIPFGRILGSRVGLAIQKMHEDNGIQFELNAGVKEFIGENGFIKQVVLPSGKILDADICVVGVGVLPATSFLKGSRVPMSERGEIIVNEYMEACEDVYACGDIVRFPLPLVGSTASIGHWQIAHNHGRITALNMLGKKQKFDSIPFFWTQMYGKSIRYCGFALNWDEIVYEGSPEEGKFAAFFVK